MTRKWKRDNQLTDIPVANIDDHDVPNGFPVALWLVWQLFALCPIHIESFSSPHYASELLIPNGPAKNALDLPTCPVPVPSLMSWYLSAKEEQISAKDSINVPYSVSLDMKCAWLGLLWVHRNLIIL